MHSTLTKQYSNHNARTHFPFLELPRELRDEVYYICCADVLYDFYEAGVLDIWARTKKLFRWLFTCRQISAEALSLLARRMQWGIKYVQLPEDLAKLKGAILKEHFQELRSLTLIGLEFHWSCREKSQYDYLQLLHQLPNLVSVEVPASFLSTNLESATTSLVKLVEACESIQTVKLVPRYYQITCRCGSCDHGETCTATRIHQPLQCETCIRFMNRRQQQDSFASSMPIYQRQIDEILAPRLRRIDRFASTWTRRS